MNKRTKNRWARGRGIILKKTIVNTNAEETSPGHPMLI